jgi:ABC-2 type transport system ATP-binding protein
MDSNPLGPMIEALRLSKIYGSFAAIRDVSFEVPRGQVCAFLGPNGAGKSTTMKILTGLLTPTAGSARLAGFDVRTERQKAAQHLGYLPENGPLYPDMTPRSLLEFFGRARGLGGSRLRARLEAVVERCALSSVLEKPIRKLSKGYRQRVGMAQALLHEPSVLILDEPTTGLDPNQIHQMRDTIRELGREKTILLSTHILQEVDAMADRILFIHQGRLIFDGTPADLRAGHASLDDAFRHRTSQAPPATSGDAACA